METSTNKIKEDFFYLHRIIAYMGWSDVILTHLSARISDDSFLISPFSLLFEEVLPEHLVLVEQGNSTYSHYKANPAGIEIHNIIMETRKDVGCIIHTHTDAGVAVSCLDRPFLIADQMSCILYNQVGYYDFNSIVVEKTEAEKIIESLGNKKFLILRNHGLVAVGINIADALWNYYYLEKACRIYISLLPALDSIVQTGHAILAKTHEQHKRFNEFGVLVPGYDGNNELLFAALKRKIQSLLK